jgi:hypothetical protein
MVNLSLYYEEYAGQNPPRVVAPIEEEHYEEYTAQHKKGDAGVPDGTTSSTVYTKNQTSCRTLNLED